MSLCESAFCLDDGFCNTNCGFDLTGVGGLDLTECIQDVTDCVQDCDDACGSDGFCADDVLGFDCGDPNNFLAVCAPDPDCDGGGGGNDQLCDLALCNVGDGCNTNCGFDLTVVGGLDLTECNQDVIDCAQDCDDACGSDGVCADDLLGFGCGDPNNFLAVCNADPDCDGNDGGDNNQLCIDSSCVNDGFCNTNCGFDLTSIGFDDLSSCNVDEADCAQVCELACGSNGFCAEDVNGFADCGDPNDLLALCDADPDCDDGALEAAAIAGIVVGSICCLICVIAIVAVFVVPLVCVAGAAGAAANQNKQVQQKQDYN